MERRTTSKKDALAVRLPTRCAAQPARAADALAPLMGIAGLALAAAVLGLNLVSFDVGPAIGLWYLVGTILMSRSISWVKDRAKERHDPNGRGHR